MTYVINDPCIGTKDTSCVEVCPVDCIHPTPDEPDFEQHEQLYIDPDECIDCEVCIPECPVNAIYAEEDVPEPQKPFIALNRDLAKSWPSITRMVPHLPDADDWADVMDKLKYLEK